MVYADYVRKRAVIMSDETQKPPVVPDEAALREQPSADFPVVGVGGSAGGLEAFRQLLQALPPDTGMAFVYIQHLDPRHPSMLPELLSKATAMVVRAAVDGARVAPNHVYVIAPNTTLTISGGVLVVRPREPAGHHLPVDQFLRSLAQDRKSRAIAVILSGTSSDGSLGLVDVKHLGGITFAQDASAKYDGMPRHAVQTGEVDFILPPDAIARELARIGQHPYLGGAGREEAEAFRPESTHLLEGIFALLWAVKGTDFHSYRHSTLRRRIARRMALLKIDTARDYLRFLEGNPPEIEALYQDLLIKVTAFFRDPGAFVALKDAVIPALVQGRSPDQPLRLWVPGCSTGEEPYSIAMCFLEALGELPANVPILIFATDANERSVQTARKGVYLENVAPDIGPQRLERFFQRDNGQYQINKAVRDLCIFAKHDVTRDPPFSNLDLISCRNLLIYMAPALQKRIVPLFHYALKPSGYLLLGASESLSGSTELFTVVDRKHRIYLHKPSAARSVFARTAGVPPAPPRLREDSETLPGNLDLEREADRLAFSRYGHAGVVVTETGETVEFKGDTTRYLGQTAGQASFELIGMAREELQVPLRALLLQAAASGEAARTEGLQVRLDGEAYAQVDLEILPLKHPAGQRHFLVLFESAKPAEPAQPEPPTAREEAENQEILRLRQQLAVSTESLQTVIEELQASSEEVLSNNEELQSINEELETGKEELQSTNEELTTINDELQARNAELAQVNTDLQNLLAAVQIPIVVLGPGMRIRLFTPAAERRFNFIPTDIGRPFTDIRSNLECQDLPSFMEEAVLRDSVVEKEVRDRDGNWYLMRARPYKTPEGKTDGSMLTLLDISSRKRMEQEREQLLLRIEHERAQLNLVIEQMPAGVVVAEAPSGRVILANRKVEQILGQPFLPVGHPDEHLHYRGFHPDHRPYAPEDWPLARALRRGETVTDEQIEYVRADATCLTMRASSAPIRDASGNIVAAVLVFEEITEQKILQERLAQSEKLETIGRLAGGVAHDFNNLLTVISGYTQLVREDPRLTRHLRTELDVVLKAANRATALTSQLLAFSRRQVIQPRILDLNPVVAAMERMLRRLVGEHIELRTRLCPRPCRVEADPGQLEQIVMNLVTNARDAVEHGGAITILTENVELNRHPELGSGPFVRLVVVDTGAGMDDETQRHLFEPFFTTKGVGRGTGLGLSSVYGMVKQNRGEMRVESAPGEGTRFEIYLPRAEEQVVRAARATPELWRGSETLLMVEDEAKVRTLARRYLKRLGYQVLVAGDGVDALRVHENHPDVISLVITDVVMPRMDGQELSQRLGALQPGLKVLFTSGYPNDVIADYGVLPEEANFLQKPFTGAELARKVRELLDSEKHPES
jgi:two-component system CheB/CheR fusion protein